jgi:hypothetical protein
MPIIVAPADRCAEESEENSETMEEIVDLYRADIKGNPDDVEVWAWIIFHSWEPKYGNQKKYMRMDEYAKPLIRDLINDWKKSASIGYKNYARLACLHWIKHKSLCMEHCYSTLYTNYNIRIGAFRNFRECIEAFKSIRRVAQSLEFGKDIDIDRKNFNRYIPSYKNWMVHASKKMSPSYPKKPINERIKKNEIEILKLVVHELIRDRKEKESRKETSVKLDAIAKSLSIKLSTNYSARFITRIVGPKKKS